MDKDIEDPGSVETAEPVCSDIFKIPRIAYLEVMNELISLNYKIGTRSDDVLGIFLVRSANAEYVRITNLFKLSLRKICFHLAEK